MAKIHINNPKQVINGGAKKYYFKVKGLGGPKGDKGDKGDTGATGPQGPQGNAATVSIGSTTTLPVGNDATVTNSGSIYNAVLNFGIPQGPRGPQGATGAKGDKGDKGDQGNPGPQGEKGTNATVTVGTTTTTEPGTQAYAWNSSSNPNNAVINFNIPRGATGATGATGPQGPTGPAGADGADGQDGQNFTPTIVETLPTTGDQSKLYLTPKAHTTSTATGNPIEATITAQAGQLESFQLDGDTFQQSYTGKNLVGLTNNTISQGGLTATVDGDTVTIDGTATGSVVSLCSANFNLTGMAGEKPAVSIFPISGSWTGGAIGFSLRNSSDSQVFYQQERYDGANFNANTLTSSALASADHAYVFAGATTVFSNFKFKIMLSDSPVIETTYEPYVGGQPSPSPEYPQQIQTVTGTQTITINGTDYPLDLGNIELNGLGDDGNGNPLYKDRIYRDGEEWKVHKATGKKVLNGSESYTRFVSSNIVRFITHIDGSINTTTRSDLFRATHFHYLGTGDEVGGAFLNSSNIGLMFGTNDESVGQFKEWLRSNNVTLDFALATPTDTTITDTTLIAQLEAIRTAILENGANTITNSATGSNLAGDMEIGYYGFNPRNRYDKWLWLDINNNYEQIGS